MQAKEHFVEGRNDDVHLVLVSLQGLVFSANAGYEVLKNTKFRLLRSNAGRGNELTVIRLRNTP